MFLLVWRYRRKDGFICSFIQISKMIRQRIEKLFKKKISHGTILLNDVSLYLNVYGSIRNSPDLFMRHQSFKWFLSMSSHLIRSVRLRCRRLRVASTHVSPNPDTVEWHDETDWHLSVIDSSSLLRACIKKIWKSLTEAKLKFCFCTNVRRFQFVGWSLTKLND